MNRNFYRALMMSDLFFRTFRHVRYRGVPVARAMFYSFHRNAMKRRGRKPGKKWAARKRMLFRRLIRTDRVARIRYRKPHGRGKIIYSPEAASGLPISRRSGIICANQRKETRKYARRGIPTCVPSSMVPLNRARYRRISRKIIATVRRKNTPRYFKNRRFLRWMLKELKTVVRTIDSIHRLLAKNRVTAIVQHSSVHTLGYLLVHMGRQRGIPTINLQYGINDDYQLFSTYPQHYVAWGPFHKRRLTQFGVPSKKIKTIGNARFDPIFRRRWSKKRKLARRLKVPARKWLFLYPEQPLPLSRNRKVLMMILHALKPYRRKVILIVKPHPRQRRMSVSRKLLRRKYRFVRVIRSKPHLYHLISGSNAVFVQFSTVGVETILMKRPVIALAMFPNTVKHEHTYYTASRYITSARGQKKLNKVIRLFLRSSAFRKRMLLKQRKYRRGTYSGKASARRIHKFIMAKRK